MAVSVGFIGLGNMGNPMAGNVLKNGFPMTVFDKNPQAMENLVKAGAKAAQSARQVAESVEVLLTCVPGTPESEDLYLGSGGVVAAAKPGNVLVDMSSVLPSTPRKLEAQAQGARRPVPGGARERRSHRRARRHAGGDDGRRRGGAGTRAGGPARRSGPTSTTSVRSARATR